MTIFGFWPSLIYLDIASAKNLWVFILSEWRTHLITLLVFHVQYFHVQYIYEDYDRCSFQTFLDECLNELDIDEFQ